MGDHGAAHRSCYAGTTAVGPREVSPRLRPTPCAAAWAPHPLGARAGRERPAWPGHRAERGAAGGWRSAAAAGPCMPNRWSSALGPSQGVPAPHAALFCRARCVGQPSSPPPLCCFSPTPRVPPALPPSFLQELWVDPLTGLPTLRHDLTIDRGMSFQAAAARLRHERSGEPGAPGCPASQPRRLSPCIQPRSRPRSRQRQRRTPHATRAPPPPTTAGPSDRSGFRVSRRPMFGRSVYLLAVQKPGAHNTFAICRPNTGGRGWGGGGGWRAGGRGAAGRGWLGGGGWARLRRAPAAPRPPSSLPPSLPSHHAMHTRTCVSCHACHTHTCTHHTHTTHTLCLSVTQHMCTHTPILCCRPQLL